MKPIALAQTTCTNPVRTANMAGFLTALQRPVIVSASTFDDMAVTAALAVEFDELFEWLRVLIH